MRFPLALVGLLAFTLLIPVSSALADPPPHAPAHGYRAKGWKSPKTAYHAPAPAPVPAPPNGVQVVFDSERGVYIGIGLPNVFFHDGTYYRRQEGRWQASPTGDGSWRRRAAFRIPDEIVDAAKHREDQPGPAAPAPDR